MKLEFLDSKEVKVFVEMMSIAAGESDYEVDRVANFEASCQAFSPIIFDLNEGSGFKEFEEACKRTAKAIITDPKIIDKLVSLNMVDYQLCVSFVNIFLLVTQRSFSF